MLITTFFISVFMCYKMNLSMGQGAPGGFMPHTTGRLARRYGARGPVGTILLINSYNRYCCQMLQILWYRAAQPYDNRMTVTGSKYDKFRNNYAHCTLRGAPCPTLRMCVCMHAFVCMHIYIYIYMCMCQFVYVCIRVRACLYGYVRTYVRTYTRIDLTVRRPILPGPYTQNWP